MISRHLALLRKSGLVTDRRAGRWIYFHINPDLPDWAKTILETTAQANKSISPFLEDSEILAYMSNRLIQVVVHDKF